MEGNFLTYLFILFGILGLGAMIYSYLAFGANVISKNSCSINPEVSCEPVIMSSYSTLLGIKLYYYGMVFFSLVIILALLSKKSEKITGYLISYISVIATGISVYLIYSEIFLIGHICILCTIGHISIFAILIISLLRFKFVWKG
mgnify:CR=1 FL=1